MKHYDEDLLLKYSLEVLDENEMNEIKEHLFECEECSSMIKQIEKENNLIGSFNPKVDDEFKILAAKKRIGTTWIKRAAVLIIGFTLGYTTSTMFQQDQVTIVKQHLITKAPENSKLNFTSCEEIDIY